MRASGGRAGPPRAGPREGFGWLAQVPGRRELRPACGDERVPGPGGGGSAPLGARRGRRPAGPGRAGGELGRQRLVGAPGRAGEEGQGGGLPEGDAGAAPVRLQQRRGADPAAARRPRLRGLQRAGRPPAPARSEPAGGGGGGGAGGRPPEATLRGRGSGGQGLYGGSRGVQTRASTRVWGGGTIDLNWISRIWASGPTWAME